MKRYIRSVIAEYQTLKDWIDKNDGVLNDNTHIVIFDMDPYWGGDPEDTPGVMFDGTFMELVTGNGNDNYFIPDDDYNLEDYLNKFSDYELSNVSEMYDGSYELTVLNNY